ncbi:MAG: hypothetical protein K6G04_02875 [Lachnospiraceae bacterium]|nr:hypothetical protein [Lachnospiraceae bacterium]
MSKQIVIGIAIVVVAIAGVFGIRYVRDQRNQNAFSMEGYVKSVDVESQRILICYDQELVNDETYMGDCYIPVEKKTKFSDGKDITSIHPGDYVIVEYTGTIQETFPSEITETVSITIE